MCWRAYNNVQYCRGRCYRPRRNSQGEHCQQFQTVHVSSNLYTNYLMVFNSARYYKCLSTCAGRSTRWLSGSLCRPAAIPTTSPAGSQLRASFLSPVPGSCPYILLVICPKSASWHASCHLSHDRYLDILLVTCPRFVSRASFLSPALCRILVSFLSPVPGSYPGHPSCHLL